MLTQSMLAAFFGRTAAKNAYDLRITRALLTLLGEPHKQFPCILVAGTNGKGSTASLIADALRCAGHRVGLYTSPHLHQPNERIVVNQACISDEALEAGYVQMCALEAQLPRPFTFFEGMTALALSHFAQHKVDVAVLEVGLGGRLDATNALPDESVMACVVTPIALDHQSVLGNSLETIAREKAGIFRAGKPAIVGAQTEEACAVLQHAAQQVGANWQQASMQQLPFATPAHLPPYWQQNAALAEAACATLDALGMHCPAEARAQARASFAWPGRYQWLPRLSANSAPILVDGGHNPAGCAALARALQSDARLRNKRLLLLFGALNDKNIADMLQPLLLLVAEVHVVACPSLRSHTKAALLAAAPLGQAHDSVGEALQHLAGHSSADADVIVVTGSLTLVGAAIAYVAAAGTTASA